ncbi:MAG: hypothetical protein V5A44_12090 [Haloarculaceae archaeon]
MSADRLPVHLNRSELHAVEVPDSFETTGSFDIELRNHGTSLHVHLHLDDALSTVAEIDAANHFIDGETQRVVRVSVDGEDELPVRGRLKVASAYGAQTRYVDVELTEPEVERHTVEVDESLAEPPADPQPKAESSPLVASPELAVLAFGVVAVLVAGGIALVVDSALLVAGAVVVLVGVLVAIYLLLVD